MPASRSNRGAKSLLSTVSVLSIAVGAAFAFGATGARAQQQPAAQSTTLGEIVVTARATEENLMTVPLAITALTAENIEAQGIAQLTDIANVAPSFHFTQGTGGGSGRNDRSSRQLTFRGLSISGGVMFVDGAPVTGANPPPISEVERIEVLKGPQSVYFGRSTFMGALNFVTKDPARDYEGRLVAEYGSFGSNDLLLSVEGPIAGDALRGRLSLSHVYRGGQYENAGDHTQKFGKQQTDSITASVIYEPNSQLTVKGYASYFVDNDGPPAQAMFNAGQFNCDLGGSRGSYYCGTLPDVSEIPDEIISGNYAMTPYMYSQIIANAQGFVTVFDPRFLTSGGLKRKGFQGHVRADYQFGGGWNVSSLTAYHRDKQQVILDLLFRDERDLVNPRYPAQPLPYPTWFLMTQNEGWDFSQEVRLTTPQDWRLRATAGATYLKQDSRNTLYGVKWTGTASSGTPGHNYPQTYGIFGGVYFDFTDQLTLTAEGRYQWDNVRTEQVGFSTGFPRPTPLQFDATFQSFSPRVSLDWEFARSSTAYALFSRAYSPGGFNTNVAGQPPSVLAQLAAVGLNETYDEERIDNFEVGVKSTFMQGRGRVTMALYYDKWRNGQISTSVPFTTELGQLNLLSITQNLGAVNLKGIELEGDFLVTPNLTLSGTFGLNDSEIITFTCGDCLAISGVDNSKGNRLGQAPKYKYTLAADYVAPLVGDIDWFARADYQYRGPFWVSHANVAEVPAQHLVNLRVGMRNERFNLEAYVRNALQDDGLRGFLGLDVTPTSFLKNQIRLSLPDRRAFGIRAGMNF